MERAHVRKLTVIAVTLLALAGCGGTLDDMLDALPGSCTVHGTLYPPLREFTECADSAGGDPAWLRDRCLSPPSGEPGEWAYAPCPPTSGHCLLGNGYEVHYYGVDGQSMCWSGTWIP